MDTYDITLLDTHPAILVTFLPGFAVDDAWPAAEKEIRQILGWFGGPLFLVADLREVRLPCDDIVSSVGLGSHGRDAIGHHPKVQGLYFVSSDPAIKTAVAGLSSLDFGGTKVQLLRSADEALEDIERLWWLEVGAVESLQETGPMLSLAG